jgi:PiT family inorganic phosphate transporter
MISSRALSPRGALLVAAGAIMLGPFLLGAAVAQTIASDLVQAQAVSAYVVMAAFVGAIVWNSLTLWLKIPSSISHALIGSLIGAAWAQSGGQVVMLSGLWKILISLFLSPFLGILSGFLLVRFSYFLTRSATPHINSWFRRGQVVASIVMAASFGANDCQKLVGMLTLGLLAVQFSPSHMTPLWAVTLSAVAIGIGTLMGGWRLIHTLGAGFYKIRPVHGFGAQIASGMVILSASVLGGPVSGSQVVTSAIIGAGSADRLQKVRWNTARQILIAWILTIPLSACVGMLTYQLIEAVAR